METVKKSLPPNPRAKANIFSVLTFWWTIDLFRKGYRKELDINDLYQPLAEDHSELLGDRLEKEWKRQLTGTKSPSLIKAMLRAFWKECTLIGVFAMLNELVRIGQPLLLGRLLEHFKLDSKLPKEDAWWAASGIVGLSLFSALNMNQFMIHGFCVGMKVRVAMCSAIYRKATKLSQTALGDTAPGKVVNLLSNDVNRFDLVSLLVHSMWLSPLFAIVVGYLMFIEVGYAAFIGIGVVFLVVPLQSYTGKLSSRFRLQTALKTDSRVRFMDEIISGVQVIKMYAWEKPFSLLIELARKLELKVIKKSAYVRGLYMTFLLFTTRMALFCTMLTMALTDKEITAARVFVISAYFNILSQTMSQMFVRGFAEIAEVLVAIRRLRQFLMYEEKGAEKKRKLIVSLTGSEKPKQEMDLADDEMIVARNVTARWATTEEIKRQKDNKLKKKKDHSDSEQTIDFIPPTLENLNFKCVKGSLIGVVGAVGSGKSSLLQIILRELPLESGEIAINGSISYTSQEPWVFASTIRQNILFGESYEKERYDKVVQACSLLSDFEQFPFGDQTIIGERGSSLSGGQKARVSLARAMYRVADIYLLDDPLSAVDAHVGRHLFDECIGPKNKLTRRQTRVLVTHQVHFLKDADWLIVLKEGHIEMQGKPSDLFKKAEDMEVFLGQLDEEDEDNENIDSHEESLSRSHSYSASQRSRRSSTKSSKGSNLNLEKSPEKAEEEIRPQTAQVGLETTSKGKVEGNIFWKYWRSGGSGFVVSIIFLLFLFTQALASGFDYFVSFWTRQEELRSPVNRTDISSAEGENQPILSTEMCIYIQGSLVLGLFLVGLCRSLSHYSLCVRASKRLHTLMFKGLISTKMRFFDTNPSGRILNRFSKDMGAADEFLPKAILDAGQMILSLFGAVVVALIVNYLFIIPIIALTVVFMMVQKVYLKSSKNIKRLDGMTRSPVFTHLGSSLTGLSTIRAFEAQGILVEEFDNLQNVHTSTWFMFLATASAFGFFLDMLSVTFVACVTFSFLALPTDTMGDQVGLAITQALVLTGLIQWGIRQSAEVANQLMSVERIMEYQLLEAEKNPTKPLKPAKEWPTDGRIQMKNVVYRYFPEADPVLKGINLTVMPKEKIGIVGRTGAGKSSLIGTLFRLAEIEGELLIDGINTGEILLSDLRSKISIIPQDPVLFSGSLRRNLDPFEEYPDSALWQSLESVELKDIAGPAGLQSEVLAGGSNFSVGQRQLICLARAILRNNKILVLDEATANVDPETDDLIQKTIRSRFEDCTVLTIAHRLHTIMDSDKVLVMEQGLVNQFDHPHVLLEEKKGIFLGMVEATGAQESDRLKEIAKQAFEVQKKAT